MKKIRYIRILVRLLVYGLLGVSALLVTSIWWLPLALPSLLRWGGVEVRSVERLDSGRLLFSELAYATDAMRCSVARVAMPAPYQYLWQRLNGEFSEASLVAADEVIVQLLPNEPAESEPVVDEGPDVVAMVNQLSAALATYAAWVPPLSLSQLQVNSSDGSPLLTARAIQLQDWQLGVLGLIFEDARSLGVIELQASLPPEAAWSARLVAPALGVELGMDMETSSEQVDLRFEMQRAAERAAGVLTFVSGGRLPVRATLTSERLSIDSEWLPSLESFQLDSAALSQVAIAWEDGRYVGELALSATALASEQASVPLVGALEFSGDLDWLRVDALQLSAEWGQLRLRQPLEVNLKDWSVSERAELQANVDLSKQPFVSAAGRVEASLSVAPSMTAEPNVRIDLNARDLVYDRYQLAALDLRGRLQGDTLSVDQMTLQPLKDDGGVVDLKGVADLATQSLDFEYSASLASAWLNTLADPITLPHALLASGQVSGSFEQPIIVGQLEPLTVTYPSITPITVSGEYRSDGLNQWTVRGAAVAAGAEIDAALVTRFEDGRVALDLNEFTWADPVRPTIKLQAPAHFSYQYAGEADYPEMRVLVAPFRLAGPELEIEAGWNPSTGLELLLRNVTLQRLGRWVDRELPSLTIESVQLSLAELRPQLLGSFAVHLETRPVGEDTPLRVDVEAQLTPTGLLADSVQLKFADAPLLFGAIDAPVLFQIPDAGEAAWRLLQKGALFAELKGSVTPVFAEWLVTHFGIKVSEAVLDLNVTGTLEQPTGHLDVKVVSLETSIEGIPAVERMEVIAKAETEFIELERFNFLVNNSEVSARLSLPTTGLIQALQGTSQERLNLLSTAEGRVELIDWQADDWVDFLPPIMRRSGQLSGLLELRPDWDVSGRLSFQDFALRPTESLPSVDLIAGEVALANRKFTIGNASAQVGGSPVAITGWLDASDFKNPLWDFSVSGLNVPLARTTDMILRSDLDVRASHSSASEAPLLSGQLNLRSSTMLVEFDPLTPNVETGPQSQPPYFSITEPTIADWRFDLKIAGDSFMRVRSPYFRTQLSANFDLGGTFAEPLLIGSVRMVDAELRFPGAKFKISSGEAYIEQGSPNTVQLNLNGIAQKSSYVITMDVTQTLADPQVHFQSTPTLSNASIIRLLTTGSVSGGGSSSVGLYLGQGLLGAGGMDEQLSDRLTVDVGEETSRSGGSTVGVRYDLSDDVFLEGGYDVYDAYNLDLIWSIFKR